MSQEESDEVNSHLLYKSCTCPLCLSTKVKRFAFKACLQEPAAPSGATGCLCSPYSYVELILSLVLYGILIPCIFIPRFAEIWGRAFLCVCARALYRALVRPEGRAFISDFSAGTGEIVSG